MRIVAPVEYMPVVMAKNACVGSVAPTQFDPLHCRISLVPMVGSSGCAPSAVRAPAAVVLPVPARKPALELVADGFVVGRDDDEDGIAPSPRRRCVCPAQGEGQGHDDGGQEDESEPVPADEHGDRVDEGAGERRGERETEDTERRDVVARDPGRDRR